MIIMIIIIIINYLISKALSHRILLSVIGDQSGS